MIHGVRPSVDRLLLSRREILKGTKDPITEAEAEALPEEERMQS